MDRYAVRSLLAVSLFACGCGKVFRLRHTDLFEGVHLGEAGPLRAERRISEKGGADSKLRT